MKVRTCFKRSNKLAYQIKSHPYEPNCLPIEIITTITRPREPTEILTTAKEQDHRLPEMIQNQ